MIQINEISKMMQISAEIKEDDINVRFLKQQFEKIIA